MERIWAGVALAAFMSGGAFGQTSPPSPVFEAADVRLRPMDPFKSALTDSTMSGGLIPGGRYELHQASMADLIRTAYGLRDYEVFGGPSWLETEHYDLLAKLPAGATQADLKPMLQALLADRFKLTVHKADEPIEANTLTLSKSGLLKESESAGDVSCHGAPNSGPSPYVTVNCQHMTMALFARNFSAQASETIPMVDSTGLKGTYDFTLKWSPLGNARPPGSAAANAPRIPFAEAVEKQLGIKIVLGKHPEPVLVVDSVNRTPTPSAPDVEKVLGEPTEFEAASVKPAKPGSTNRRFEITRGRIEVVNVPIRALIATSANLISLQAIRNGVVDRDFEKNFERDMIVGGPKWIETESFDIVAKTGDASPFTPEFLPGYLAVMLRNLLAERFKLVTHTEQRSVPVWALVVGKGGTKLTPADPKSRSGCKWSESEPGTGSAAILLYSFTCRNVTMAQLAETLHFMGRAFVDHPAVDMTGLTGGYDFTITYSPQANLNALQAQGQASGAGAVPEAGDPRGMNFVEALEKLGLKLDSGHKAPQSVIIIDHVEPLTADN
jgi:uncharacterized protein (TIGR03435 family)